MISKKFVIATVTAVGLVVAAALTLKGDATSTWLRAGTAELSSKQGQLELSAAPQIILLRSGDEEHVGSGQADIGPSFISVRGGGGGAALTAREGQHGLTISDTQGKTLTSLPR